MSSSDVHEATLADAFFDALAPQAEDVLLGLIDLFRADTRAGKIDLGVGVYKDAAGRTPVMRAVKAAEAALLARQNSKSYLGADGSAAFTTLLARIVFGAGLACRDRLTGVQTPGGTGALRLGAELVRAACPQATVWVGTPTWPNHAPIFAAAGLNVRTHRFYDIAAGEVTFDAMCADLSQAAPGDVLLLHGCCHNPTGAVFTDEQWRALIALCRQQALVPFVDLAYQGLGDGLDADARMTQTMLAELPSALVAYSCDKNFGLYRDRVGALWVRVPLAEQIATVRGNLLQLASALWAMPPDHGAAVVQCILEDDDLRQQWHGELDGMRARINEMRTLLAAAHPRMRNIASQRGMFAMLPIDPKQAMALREHDAIYLPTSGRINIAGLTAESTSRLVASLAPYL